MIHKVTLVGACFLLFCPSSAKAENIQQIPEFRGGLNKKQILACEKQYQKECSKRQNAPFTEGIIQKWECMEQKMAQDTSCTQADQIYKKTGYFPEYFRQYGPVAVFNITTLADGQEIFYLVDAQGQLISLNSNFDLKDDKTYLFLQKKYKNVALTTFLYFDEGLEFLRFPRYYILPNKNQQLIFRQALRDGECVACATVGFAKIAYEFNPEGVFLGSSVLDVLALLKESEH